MSQQIDPITMINSFQLQMNDICVNLRGMVQQVIQQTQQNNEQIKNTGEFVEHSAHGIVKQ